MQKLKLIVESNNEIARDTFLMALYGDCETCAPGQFIDIELEEHFLRRPISVLGHSDGRIEILYKVVGSGTSDLADKLSGDVLSVLAPLGNGFSLDDPGKHPLLVAGGIGLPPILFLAEKMAARGIKPAVVLGFRSEDDILLRERFERLGIEPLIALEQAADGGNDDMASDSSSGMAAGGASDSSSGMAEDGASATGNGAGGAFVRGLVTDAMRAVQAGGYDYDRVFACGPLPMLKAVYELSPDGEFSLEERMGCGFGACMGCSIKTRSGYRRVCKDGPVFEKKELLW